MGIILDPEFKLEHLQFSSTKENSNEQILYQINVELFSWQKGNQQSADF